MRATLVEFALSDEAQVAPREHVRAFVPSHADGRVQGARPTRGRLHIREPRPRVRRCRGTLRSDALDSGGLNAGKTRRGRASGPGL